LFRTKGGDRQGNWWRAMGRVTGRRGALLVRRRGLGEFRKTLGGLKGRMSANIRQSWGCSGGGGIAYVTVRYYEYGEMECWCRGDCGFGPYRVP